MTEIVTTEDVMGGEPRIAGRRISVLQIADMVREGGRSPEYVADQLDLSLAAVHTALAYFYDHPGEMDTVRERHRELETTLRSASSDPPTPDQ